LDFLKKDDNKIHKKTVTKINICMLKKTRPQKVARESAKKITNFRCILHLPGLYHGGSLKQNNNENNGENK